MLGNIGRAMKKKVLAEKNKYRSKTMDLYEHWLSMGNNESDDEEFDINLKCDHCDKMRKDCKLHRRRVFT